MGHPVLQINIISLTHFCCILGSPGFLTPQASTPEDERKSFYDNVPVIIYNKSYVDVADKPTHQPLQKNNSGESRNISQTVTEQISEHR